MTKNLPYLILTFAYFLLRLPRLTLTPMFTDEAIYLRWSQVISRDLSFLYLPLTDGKPPLSMWLTALVMHFFPGFDPLLLGRLVSLGFGFFSFVGIIFAALTIFKNRRLAVFAAAGSLLIPPVFL